MKIHCESIDYKFELPQKPQRVISLVAAATETLFAMGCGNSVVGVSCYCERYVPDLKAPVVGDYLKIDQKRSETGAKVQIKHLKTCRAAGWS